VGAAEFDGKGRNLTAGFFERAGAVDFLGGMAQLFLDRELGSDAAAGFVFTEAACEESFELLFRFAPGYNDAIEFFVNTGFDEERGFDESGIADSGAVPQFKLAENDFGDTRVDDGVETVEFCAVGEDDGAELRAVDSSAGAGDGRAEFAEDFVVCGLSRLDELVREGVRVQNGEAEFAEHGSDGAFAAGDAAGEAKSKHDFKVTARGRLIAWQKILVKRGGCARL
jgi:hypothetical protein